VTTATDVTATAGYTIEPGSFRDRTARVFYADGAVYRGLTALALEEWKMVSVAPFFKSATAKGQIVATETVDSSLLEHFSLPAEWKAVLRHQTLRFITYPYEWCFGMLKDAALLQLELLAAALDQGITLKDATPFNIQWAGTNPVFIDTASFVRWRRGEPWAGYRQFCRMFLYPLMLQAYKGVPFQARLRGRLEGIDADECRRLMSFRDLIRPGILTHVVAQRRLEQQYGASDRNIKKELQHAGLDSEIITGATGRLVKLTRGLDWSPRVSAWSDYACCNTYDEEASRTKERFVEAVVRAKRRHLVWDLGCNTGRFAKVAAKHADYVVAVDSDHESIERLYRELRQGGNANILPLVADVADPSPALGWRGRERLPMLDRGQPDLVLCLALIHHLAITSNIPIADVLAWLAQLGADLVIEFPTPEDPMVQRLLRNKDQRYDDYCVDNFETFLAKDFRVQEVLALPSGTRILYHALPRHRSVRSIS
jgi:SAM-dependent methyltransferase